MKKGKEKRIRMGIKSQKERIAKKKMPEIHKRN